MTAQGQRAQENTQNCAHALFFLDLQVGGQKGLRRESRKPFAVNAGFLLFGWSASIPFDQLSRNRSCGCHGVRICNPAQSQTVSHEKHSNNSEHEQVSPGIRPEQPVRSESAEAQAIELNHIEAALRHRTGSAAKHLGSASAA
jgi:hypothetical protein